MLLMMLSSQVLGKSMRHHCHNIPEYYRPNRPPRELTPESHDLAEKSKFAGGCQVRN
jgi:hypothetical protein